MAFDDSVGTIAIDIVGDYSQLQQDLDAAANAAEAAGTEIANAFNLADATQLELFTSGLEEMAPAAEAAGTSLAGVGEEAVEAGKHAEEAEGGFGGLFEKLEEIGTELAVGLGFVETIKELIEVTGQIQKATVSLTALMGSAQEANARLEELRHMADEEGLSFPALVEANQRMVAFGFATEAIQPALEAAADAAAALNKTVSETSDAMDRMAISGMANARQLVSLGLSTSDLAKAMGVAEDQAKAVFKVLDESTRIEVLTTAIENVREFAGLAQKTAETLPGQWQQVKNAFETAFQSIGSFMAPVISQFMTFVKSIGEAIDLLARLAHATGRAAIGRGFTLPEDAPGGAVAGGGLEYNAALDPDAVKKKVADQVAAAGMYTMLVDKMSKYAAPDFRSDLGIQIALEQAEEASLKKTAAAIGEYGLKLETAGVILTGAALEQAYFTHQMDLANLGMREAENSFPPVIDAYGKITTVAKQAGDEQKALNLQMTELEKSLISMDVAKPLKDIKPPADAAAEAIYNVDKALSTGDFARAEQQINRLAKDDLPAAVAEYDRLIAAAQAHGKTEGEIIALTEKKLDLQIRYGEDTGASATAAIVGLQNAKIETQLLIDKSTALGDVYVGLTNTFMNAWGQFSSGISDAIVNGKNFGDTMMGVLKKIEQEIINTFVGYALKELRDSLIQSSGLLSHVTAQIASITGAGAGGVQNMPASLAASGGTGGGVVSSVGGGGLLGAAGAIGSVASAISNIVSNVQQAHANNLLGEIEVSTRGALNQLISIQNTLNTYLPTLPTIMAWTGEVMKNTASGMGITFANCNFSGVDKDTIDALAAALFRQFKLAGG